MFLLYDLIFLIVAAIHLPLYLLRGKFRHGLSRRLGFLPQGLKLNRPIWIHAVSVGEAVTVKGLVEGLKKEYPSRSFVVSTVTATGNKIAAGFASGNDFLTYLPLDFSFIVRKVINKINPKVFIIAETELWPNLISYLYKRNIPIIVVNGRISDGSFRGYGLIKFLLKPILNKVTLFCVQTERDARRLISLGASPERVRVAGNMKFDAAVIPVNSPDQEKYRKLLSLSVPDKLLVCGSTHPGEEEIILKAYKDLQKEFPYLKLLIAPRHPDRAKEIERLILRYGFNPVSISSIKPAACSLQPAAVFILDIIGQLVSFYALADIVFVGGSLIKKGGHNILEPASLAKPIIIGPHMFNFRDIAELFLASGAVVSARGKEDLNIKIKELLQDPGKAKGLGERAKALILDNAGATRNNLNLIKALLREDRCII